MRRPLALQIETLVPEEEQAGFARPDVQASISFQSFSGDLRLVSNSLREYKFTEQGLHRTEQQQTASTSKFYEISDRDVQILEPLGEGASSTVYKGLLEKEGCHVAVKRINCLDREKRRQLMNDVRGLCDVHHPSLVQFLGAYRNADRAQISIVLEYMDCGSLADLVKRAGGLPEAVLSNITAQALEGLVCLHRTRHMVHRDIKPANVLLNSSGRAKIADFGISAFVDSTLAMCNTFLGTVTYMSPERINSRPYSFAADIWSLGLSLLECWLGRYPYDAAAGPLVLMMQMLNDPVPLPAEGACSPEFRDFLRLCLQKDPHARPPAHELLRHKFVTQHMTHSTDLRKYLTSLDSCQRSRQVEAEQQARRLLERYYARLSSPDPASALAAMGPDLATGICMAHEGEEAHGRAAALKQLRSACELQLALGATRIAATSIEIQELQGGSLLALAAGHIEMSEGGPLGSALKQDSATAPFSQAFQLARETENGPLFIANSMFRHL